MTIEEIYSIYRGCGGRVTTDSRAVRGGELFIALKGENFDGNDYALTALEAGAAYALVDAGSAAAASGDARMVVVEDSFESLKALANWHRNHCLVNGKRLTVIGLTGTNGKTTTKELIRSVLSAKYRVTATKGNLNNDIGVPLSLLSIDDSTELAVIEMGANHPDDISHLVSVCEPDYGLITNVGKAHLLGFGSFDGVKRAKGQLYDYVAGHQGSVFVNADDENLLSMARSRDGLTLIPYGRGHDGATLLPVTAENPFLRIAVGENVVNTRLVGSYNAANVLAALCVGAHFSVPSDDAVKAIEAYVPANSRSQMQRTGSNVLIMDAYNANPSSMAASLENFRLMEASHKVALLGDMRELGADALKEHCSVLERVAQMDCDAYLVGEEFAAAVEKCGLPANVKAVFATSQALAEHLAEHPLSGACILVKGSRGIMMEKATACL